MTYLSFLFFCTDNQPWLIIPGLSALISFLNHLSSMFSLLSARSSLPRCLSKSAVIISSPFSSFTSSSAIWSYTLSLILFSSSSYKDKAIAMPCLFLLKSVISFQAGSFCLYLSYDFALLNEGDLSLRSF